MSTTALLLTIAVSVLGFGAALWVLLTAAERER